jgi:hypothetical protein
MDEKQFREFLRQIDLLRADVEEAADELKTKRSELSAAYKSFKKNGGKLDALKQCMAMRKLDEGDLIQLEEDRKRYAAWMRLPIGGQADMFAEAPDTIDDGADDNGADDGPDEPSHAPAAVVAAPMTARAKRGRRGPQLVEPPNTTDSPFH